MATNKYIPTPDLCDDNEGHVAALETQFHHYGLHKYFSGQVVTVKCFEDNSVIKALVNTPGNDRVIVVDGGGSMRRALLGDMLADAAVQNGWAGLVINGCIRDVQVINQLELGVMALGTHPMKTDKRGEGQQDIPVSIGGVTIKSGDFVYADENGVIVSNKSL
ncbi:MAG: ribonuclease E activity regulator RraA [Gammaproteobacteria bacterium]|nr:ribonuclease E activity regulator RraA [Gammaproteobacteria bacterium]